MTQPLRIAVIGAGGRIAGDYLQVLDASSTLQVAALCETDAAACQRLAAERDEPLFASLDELLGAEIQLDAALVATPPANHEPTSLALLEAGLHVLCEKPLAPSLDSARRMLDAASRRGLRLMMASKFRFVADVVTAREKIAAGEIGRALRFRNAFRGEVDMAGRWNSDLSQSGGGVLIDNGTHAIDIARFLLGEISQVRATALEPGQALAVEDRVEVEFETRAGQRGLIELSWSDPGDRPTYVEIEGEAGALAIGWRDAWLRATGSDQDRSFGSGYDKRLAFTAQLEHFAAVVRGEEPPRIDDADALASVRFVSAAYRSMAEQRWVSLAEIAAEVA